MVASLFAIAAFKRGARLPDDEDEDYISEKYYQSNTQVNSSSPPHDEKDNLMMQFMKKIVLSTVDEKPKSSQIEMEDSSSLRDEYVGLLSEVEEVDEAEVIRTNQEISSMEGEECAEE